MAFAVRANGSRASACRLHPSIRQQQCVGVMTETSVPDSGRFGNADLRPYRELIPYPQCFIKASMKKLICIAMSAVCVYSSG
jgi:hypothetical protein